MIKTNISKVLLMPRIRIKVETLKCKTKVITTTTPQQQVVPPQHKISFKYIMGSTTRNTKFFKKILYCGL